MFKLGESKHCSPYCKFMRCQKQSLIIKGPKRLCRLTFDDCSPVNCQFALCEINKLLFPDGICGEWVERSRPKKVSVDISEVMDETDIKVRGRKLKL